MLETAESTAVIAAPPYHNLTITLAEADAAQLLVGLQPEDGPASAPVLVPGALSELTAIAERMRASFQLPAAEQLALGEQLGRWLLPSAVRPTFWALWRDVVAQHGTLRLRLDCATAALNLVPWEFASVPRVSGGPAQPLIYDPRLSLVRLGPAPSDVVSAVTDDALPLSLLLLLAGAADQPPLKLAKEQKRVLAGIEQLPAGALGAPMILEQASWSQVVDALTGTREADLVHFAGHGYYAADEAGLLFHDDSDPTVSRRVSAAELATRLRGRNVKVVVLSACELGRADIGGQSGVAQQLLAAGIPAVIAMQFEVGDREATAFASGFYTALATGAAVDAAVAEGRLRMAATVADTTGWGCPVLYMRTTDAALFQPSGPLPPAVAAAQAQLVVNQVSQQVAGQLTGVAIGTLVLRDGQVIVNQEVATITATGEVVGERIGTLVLDAGSAAAGVAVTGTATPASQPADPVAAGHLQPTEATAPPEAAPAVGPPTDSPALAALFADTATFVGRAHVRAAISEFLSTRNRIFVVVGPPGSGKTALAARLVVEQQRAGTPWLYSFCGIEDGDNPQQFITHLAAQLAALLPQYTVAATAATGGATLALNVTQTVGTSSGTVIGNQIGELNIGELHPREAFRRLIQEPLRSYDRARGPDGQPLPLVIVVDALDRAWDWDGGQSSNIVALLSDVQDLPPWVNVICTARPGAALQSLRTRGGVRVFDLTD